MYRFRGGRFLAAAIVLALCLGGLLTAQRRYRGVPLPPIVTEMPDPEDAHVPAEFYFARLKYSDPYGPAPDEQRPWFIDSPAAERHFLQGVRRLSNIDARSKEVYITAFEDELFDYPWLYVVEAGHWAPTDEECARLREYLLRGGFMIFDDFHGTLEWAIFMRGMNKIMPERPVVDISEKDEILHVLYDLDERTQIPGIQFLYTGKTYEHDGYDPHWRGIYDDDGRLMVLINFNMDLGDAWEHADWPEYPERYTALAYRLGINYIVYSMTH